MYACIYQLNEIQIQFSHCIEQITPLIMHKYTISKFITVGLTKLCTIFITKTHVFVSFRVFFCALAILPHHQPGSLIDLLSRGLLAWPQSSYCRFASVPLPSLLKDNLSAFSNWFLVWLPHYTQNGHIVSLPYGLPLPLISKIHLPFTLSHHCSAAFHIWICGGLPHQQHNLPWRKTNEPSIWNSIECSVYCNRL